MDPITNETESASVWPLDITKLSKGQVIGQKECETITGIDAEHSRFPFELMRLREFIMVESERAGTAMSVAIRGNALVINTDGEASHYHSKLAKQAERSIHRNFYHLVKTVDSGKLTENERREHERRVSIWAMKAGRLKDKGLPHERAKHISNPQGDGGPGAQE